MSTYIVPDKQIHLLAAIYHSNKYEKFPKWKEDIFHINYTIRQLITANVKALNERYNKVNHVNDYELPETWESVDYLNELVSKYTVVEKLKLLSNFEYQASDAEDWKTSKVYDMCQIIQDKLCRQLDGWDRAPWGMY